MAKNDLIRPMWLFIPIATALLVILLFILKRLGRAYRIQVVTCVIRPEQLADVTIALKQANLALGMTVINVRGFGRQQGEGAEADLTKETTFRLLPKLKLEILARHHDIEKIMDVIGKSIRTGLIGDGKLVVFDVVYAMRVRTGEQGLSAL